MALAPPRFVGEFGSIPGDGLRGQYGPYIADPGLVHAANTALVLEMRLLLTGCGKSDYIGRQPFGAALVDLGEADHRADRRARHDTV